MLQVSKLRVVNQIIYFFLYLLTLPYLQYTRIPYSSSSSTQQAEATATATAKAKAKTKAPPFAWKAPTERVPKGSKIN